MPDITGLLSGFGGDVRYNNLALLGAGDYDLKITGETDSYTTLANPVETDIMVYKDWSLDVNMETNCPARSFGLVTIGNWAGVLMSTWDASIEAKMQDCIIQSEQWKRYTVGSISWKVESEKFMATEGNQRDLFLRALATGVDQAVTVRTPLFGGNGTYKESSSGSGSKAAQEKVSITSRGTLTAPSGSIPLGNVDFAALIAVFNSYISRMVAGQDIVPVTVTISNRGNGKGLLQKLAAKSDGKRVKISATIQGSGAFTFQ